MSDDKFRHDELFALAARLKDAPLPGRFLRFLSRAHPGTAEDLQRAAGGYLARRVCGDERGITETELLALAEKCFPSRDDAEMFLAVMNGAVEEAKKQLRARRKVN
jgi:hypothetical protein